MAEYQSIDIQRSYLFIVPEFTYNFVGNYIRNKNKVSGDANLGKGHKYFSESSIFGIKGMYYVIVIPLLESSQVSV